MPTREITPAVRAVYELVESKGGIDKLHARLYRHQIAALVDAGLLVEDPTDASVLRPVADRGSQPPPARTSEMVPPAITVAPPAPPAPPKEPPMQTLVTRVPEDWHDALESLRRDGETKSDVVRRLLGRALSGASSRRVKAAS